jgi:hypothetical protein
MNRIPKITISPNKELDKKTIYSFAKEKEPYILESFPELKSVNKSKLKQTVDQLIDELYKEELLLIKERIKELKTEIKTIEEICKIISEITGCDWQKYPSIKIYIGLSPVAPRFLREGSFLLPRYESAENLLNYCAHELIHFLYFVKWKSIFKDNYSSYEHPHPAWVLSEILAPVIINDRRIKIITKYKATLYPHWKSFDKEYQLLKTFSEIYKKSDTFEEFLIKSEAKYQELDAKFSITKKLTQ